MVNHLFLKPSVCCRIKVDLYSQRYNKYQICALMSKDGGSFINLKFSTMMAFFFLFRDMKLNLITEGSPNQNHGANLWTCFFHKAFLHEVSS